MVQWSNGVWCRGTIEGFDSKTMKYAVDVDGLPAKYDIDHIKIR